MKTLWLVLRLSSPARSYAVFCFLVTVFLLFRKQPRWFLWKPLSPEALLATIRRLGASFLKLAQVLATRADFFPPPYLEALRQLHDRMPPMTKTQQQQVFSRAFADPHIFASFDPEPFASASIGQVHRARIHGIAEPLAVKLLRADIQLQVRIDIFLLSLFLRLFRPLFSHQTRHSIEAVLRAFTQVIKREVSMTEELNNLEHFSQVYAESGVRFPRPYVQFCSDHALVMSFEEGVRIDDVAAVEQLKIPFTDLMQQLVLFYTEQMLVKGFFHADPHPGNLLVRADGQLVLLDFGMVSRIPRGMREAMIYAVKASYERNFELLISATRRMGILTENVDPQTMSEVAERLFEIFDSEHLNASSMQNLAFGVLGLLQDQPFKLPQDIVYVMRVSSLIEGLGTQYIENFNGVKDILPILKKTLPRALGEDRLPLERVQRELFQLPLTLERSRKVIELAEQGELAVRLATADRRYLITRVEACVRQVGWLIFWLGLAFYLQQFPQPWTFVLSLGCLGLAAFSLRRRA